jgi:quercetin dioxygenase-like cupin family protein
METMIYPRWSEMVTFSAEGPQPQVLLADERLKVVVAGLLPGQLIPPHPESLGVFHILEGNGWMTVAGERLAIEAGATVTVPDGVARGLEAQTQLAFMAIRVTS